MNQVHPLNSPATNAPLSSGLQFILKFAGYYNIVAGLAMVIFYHEGFRALGVPKPEFVLPIQLVGVLVAIFGVGYLIAERNPIDNRNIVLLGFLSKLLGPLLAIMHISSGNLPVMMLAVLFFADGIYLIPFWVIYRRLSRLAS
jgi:uncharacterized membrane protein HdeD (DUF308 family)